VGWARGQRIRPGLTPPARQRPPPGCASWSKGCWTPRRCRLRRNPKACRAFAGGEGRLPMRNLALAWKELQKTGSAVGRQGWRSQRMVASRASRRPAPRAAGGLSGDCAADAHPADAVAGLQASPVTQRQRRLARENWAYTPTLASCSGRSRAGVAAHTLLPALRRPLGGGGLAADHPGLCSNQRHPFPAPTQRRDHRRTPPERWRWAGRDAAAGRCSTPVAWRRV